MPTNIIYKIDVKGKKKIKIGKNQILMNKGNLSSVIRFLVLHETRTRTEKIVKNCSKLSSGHFTSTLSICQQILFTKLVLDVKKILKIGKKTHS